MTPVPWVFVHAVEGRIDVVTPWQRVKVTPPECTTTTFTANRDGMFTIVRRGHPTAWPELTWQVVWNCMVRLDKRVYWKFEEGI